MRKIYVLLILCLLILSVFISCDDKNQGVELVTITLDSGILKEEAKTIETAENTSVILPSGDSLWSTSGYTFSGWAETATGIDKYKAGDKYSSSKSTTLYAVWTVNPKITYDSNNGTCDTITEYYKSGEKVTIKETSFTKDGYTLSYWSTSPEAKDTYTIGQEITLTKDLTLYAVWVENENKATITYSSNGGSGTIRSVSYAKGTEVKLDGGTALSRDGFKLSSWNTSSDGEGTKYELGSTHTFNEDVTLYAIWTENYNIKYYSYNEGDGKYKLIAIDYPQGTSTTIGDGNGLSKEGFALYWTTNPDGTGIPYDVGEEYTEGTSISLCAQWEADNGLEYTFDTESKTYSVTDCTTDLSGEVTIPSLYKGKKVTAIEDSAFGDCSSVKNITIPDTVTSIGSKAFACCYKLTSFDIPDSVSSIGSDAFYKCIRLKSIYVDKQCDSNMGAPWGATKASVIWADYFDVDENGQLKVNNSINKSLIKGTVLIPNNVQSKEVSCITDSAFEGCTALVSVTIPDSVICIKANAFEGCNSLTSIEIPSRITSIGSDAFKNCTSLTSIYIDKEYGSFSIPADKWGAPETCTVRWKPSKVDYGSAVNSVGDIMELGTYPDSAGNYAGKAVTWKALSVDTTNKRALMISEKVLETRAFDANKSVVYAGSGIHTYLTGSADTDFIKTYGIITDKMLSVNFESSIETTTVGSGTDKLFLLSYTEAFKSGLFADDEAREATDLGGNESSWWLRSADSYYENCMKYVMDDGDLWVLDSAGTAGLRPAFWYTWE